MKSLKLLSTKQIDKIVMSHWYWLNDNKSGKIANFDYCDLGGYDFSYKNLFKANFTNCDLRKCKFAHTILSKATFSKCLINDPMLISGGKGAKIIGCSLTS